MKYLHFLLLCSATAFCADYPSPNALCQGNSPQEIWVTDIGKSLLYRVNVEEEKVISSIPLPPFPTGVACSKSALFITLGVPEGSILACDPITGRELFSIPAGHSPCSPVLSPDETILFVCNRFDNQVAAYDIATRQPKWKTAIPREPVAAALSPDGTRLAVANLLPYGPATKRPFSAEVSVLEASTGKILAHIPLPNGSTGLLGITISPDGRFAYVTHTLGRYQSPTKQVDFGWMNANALTVIDLGGLMSVATVLLDDLEEGAANPWGVAATEDRIVVTHAGTREVSVIDRIALHEKLDRLARGEAVSKISTELACVQNDLEFLKGIRTRIPLSAEGPRAVMIWNHSAVVTDYFAGRLSIVPLDPPHATRGLVLSDSPDPDPIRRGEILFSSAAMCRQKWQSCASCHPDARVDGFNWDLLNDGAGNPKNVQSMLNAHRTPPAMWSGVRETAETAVRAGFRHIQFYEIPEQDAAAVDAFLNSLTPVKSPAANDPSLLGSIARGRTLFQSTGCSECHSGAYFTDGKAHNLGTGEGVDAGKSYVTPSLVECWRTAPYFHDGRAASLQDVMNDHEHADKIPHPDQLDLKNFLLSL